METGACFEGRGKSECVRETAGERKGSKRAGGGIRGAYSQRVDDSVRGRKKG